MNEQLQWHTEEGRLLRELRRSSLHWGRPPEIAGYDELVELKRGGQGVVYRARQRSTNRTVAIKVLLDGALASETGRLRFQREIDLAAKLRHPNIVRIYDSSLTEDGRLFYVMEHVDGAALDEATVSESGNVARIMELFASICDAVQHAHQRGVIHRDLKPGNILVDETGEPQVLDFGIAKIAAEDEATGGLTVSSTGQFLGSLAWASPEQIEADGQRVDTRTDIYSLGVILYQLLTGQLPHPIGRNLRQTLEAIAMGTPARPRSIRREIPDDVEAITLRCLERDPERRYESAAALVRDVRHYLAGEPIEAKRTVAWRRMQRAVKRYRYSVIASVLAVGVLLTFGAAMSVLYRRATEAEALVQTRVIEARRQASRAESVTEFLRGTLISVDPARSGGREPTVREMLDEAALRLPAALAREPLARARVSGTLGLVYLDFGLYEPAEEILSDAVAIYESRSEELDDESGIGREDRIGYAEALSALAAIDHQLQRIDTAVQRYERALAIWREEGSEGHTESIAAMIHLGLLKSSTGELEETEALYLRALALACAGEPVLIVQVAHALFRLGDLYFEQGRNEEAERYFVESLGMQDAGLPPTQLVIIECQRSYVRLLIATERYEEAARIAADGLESTVSLYGRFNHRSALWMTVLADARAGIGDAEEAERLYREALEVARGILGDTHLHVAFIEARLGKLLYRELRFGEAETVFLEAQRIFAATHPDHRTAVVVRGFIGCCLAQRGRVDEAEAILRDALAALPELFDGDLPDLVDLQACLDEIEATRNKETAPANP